MASVQMSQTLRDQITTNYTAQLQLAYRKAHHVQPAIDAIIHGITDRDPDFAKLCELQDEYGKMLEKTRKTYEGASYYSNATITEEIVQTSTTLGLICNPNRPAEENGTYISRWEAESKDEYNDNGRSPASDNWVEGDVPVALGGLEPYYAPARLCINYTKGWHRQHFAPHTEGCAIVITDPELCSQLSPIGEIEIKVNADVETFEEYISKITTLKRFIDEWPGGRSLVPDEYIQRMTAKKQPSQAKRMTPDQIIPDELKEQMNEVILENKLLGD